MATSNFTYNAAGTVSAVFFSRKDMESAYQSLLERGHSAEDISVLLSDETLQEQNTFRVEEASDGVVELGRATGTVVGTLLSIPSLISIPNLGMTISKALWNKLVGDNPGKEFQDQQEVIATKIPAEHTTSYGESMKEGGVIISVDPRNEEEQEAIVLDFKRNNGQDILGADGYATLN